MNTSLEDLRLSASAITRAEAGKFGRLRHDFPDYDIRREVQRYKLVYAATRKPGADVHPHSVQCGSLDELREALNGKGMGRESRGGSAGGGEQGRR